MIAGISITCPTVAVSRYTVSRWPFTSAIAKWAKRPACAPAPKGMTCTEVLECFVGARDGLGHDRAVQLAEWRLQKQLAALADQCPDHTISTESYPGRGRRFVARARPGTAARP